MATVSYDQWCELYNDTSTSQGWTLFDAEGVIDIERIDCPTDEEMEPLAPILADDGEALRVVFEQAARGCPMSLLALYLDGRDVNIGNKLADYYIPDSLEARMV